MKVLLTCHCEEAYFADEAISDSELEIASLTVFARNDMTDWGLLRRSTPRNDMASVVCR